MEKNKLNLILFVADKLSAAPEGDAKADLVEELSDNLYQRYTDLVAAGVPEEEALQRAKDELGDAEELVDYLKGLEPGQPLPGAAAPGSQLDDVLRDVEEICRAAMDAARSTIQSDAVQSALRTTKDVVKDAMHTVKDAVSSMGDWGKDGSADNLDQELGDLEKEFDELEREADEVTIRVEAGQGDEVTVRVETDQKDGAPGKDLRGIDVQTGAGDVTIRVSQSADGDVLVGGDIEDLEVARRGDTLVIRQGRTASSSFLFGRGVGCADVVLDLPLRDWALLKVLTGNGDVDLELEGIRAEDVFIRTGAGDVRGRLPFAGTLNVKSGSGDIDWHGDAGILQCESASGDVSCRGAADAASIHSVSGDVDLKGSFPQVRCGSVSGDVRLDSEVLPDQMDISSTSGDCEAHIPDGGGFVVNFKTASGEFTSDFFEGNMRGKSNTFTYQGGGPAYSMKSLSGDLRLKKH